MKRGLYLYDTDRRIRRARRGHDLPLRDVSAACGVAPPSLSEMERGRKPLDLRLLLFAAQRLEISLDSWMGSIRGVNHERPEEASPSGGFFEEVPA